MSQITIVGGGAIGMLTALELAGSGHQVTLFERQETGRESSWAGGGIVSPLFPWRYLDSITELASWSQAHYAEVCATLADATGIDPEYTGSGLLLIAPEETAAATAWAETHGRKLEVVDRARFASLEPETADSPEAAFWMPDVGQLRNPRMVKALRRRLDQLGVSVRTHCEVDNILHHQGRCSGVATDAGPHHADAVVVCAGAWSAGLLRRQATPPDIRPIRGQMLMFRATPGTITRMVLEGSRYVIPRRDGRTLFGSTLEDVGFNKQTTGEARDELYDIATRRFPVLRRCPVEAHWAGLRPSSPAGVPYIGEHPQIEGLFVNAGHFRNGIVLGLASSRLVSDLVLGRTPILDPAPYAWTAPRG